MANSVVAFFPMFHDFLKNGKRENADSGFSMFMIAFSVATYIYDVVTDIKLVVVHYSDGNLVYFYLTLIFILVPAVIMTCFSLRFYINDDIEFKKLGLPRASPLDWLIRGIFLIFLTGPILRYLDTIRYSIKALQGGPQKAFYQRKMIRERNCATFLRVIESFTEAVPQGFFVLCMTAGENEDDYLRELTETERYRILSLFGSSISAAMGLVECQLRLRAILSLNATKKKMPQSWSGFGVMFLWHFFEAGSRALALGLFLYTFPFSGAIVFVAHFGIIWNWLITMKIKLWETRCEEITYDKNPPVAPVVFMFRYFIPHELPARWGCIIFYLFAFVENFILMAAWYNYTDAISYKSAAILIHFLRFAISIVLMVIYYLLVARTSYTKERCVKCSVKAVPRDNCNGLKTVLHSIDSQDQYEDSAV